MVLNLDKTVLATTTLLFPPVCRIRLAARGTDIGSCFGDDGNRASDCSIFCKS